MARICKYGCGTMLEGFDEDKRRYIEYGTTDCLHTVDRCKEAKAKRQEKDDHGKNRRIKTPTINWKRGLKCE